MREVSVLLEELVSSAHSPALAEIADPAGAERNEEMDLHLPWGRDSSPCSPEFDLFQCPTLIPVQKSTCPS